jgi:hypothetical protein
LGDSFLDAIFLLSELTALNRNSPLFATMEDTLTARNGSNPDGRSSLFPLASKEGRSGVGFDLNCKSTAASNSADGL